MISSLKKLKTNLFWRLKSGWPEAKTTNATLINVTRQNKTNQTTPKAAHWWLLFLPMHHQHHLHQWSQSKQRDREPETVKKKENYQKTRQIATEKKSVFYVWWLWIRSVTWQKQNYPQFREKKTILIPVIKTKTLKTKYPPPILPCPP